jgi:glycine cleavage system H protein
MAEKKVPADLQYSKEHEWVKVEGGLAVVGLTDYGQRQVGNITYVELPKVGTKLGQMDEMCVMYPPKTVTEIYAPLGGVVAVVNQALTDDPKPVNKDCYGSGWLLKLKDFAASDLDGLLDAAGYQKLVDSQA